MEIKSGIVRLQVIQASLIRDTEWFSKMDPWAQIITKQQKFRTRTIQGAGTEVSWKMAFNIKVDNVDEETFELSVFDDDDGSHSLVGNETFKIKEFVKNGGKDEWVFIRFEKAIAGKVHLISEWKPDAAPEEVKQEQEQAENVDMIAAKKLDLQDDHEMTEDQTQASNYVVETDAEQESQGDQSVSMDTLETSRQNFTNPISAQQEAQTAREPITTNQIVNFSTEDLKQQVSAKAQGAVYQQNSARAKNTVASEISSQIDRLTQPIIVEKKEQQKIAPVVETTEQDDEIVEAEDEVIEENELTFDVEPQVVAKEVCELLSSHKQVQACIMGGGLYLPMLMMAQYV